MGLVLGLGLGTVVVRGCRSSVGRVGGVRVGGRGGLAGCV